MALLPPQQEQAVLPAWDKLPSDKYFQRTLFGKNRICSSIPRVYILSIFKQKQGGKCVSLAWTTATQSHSNNYVFGIGGVLQELP